MEMASLPLHQTCSKNQVISSHGIGMYTSNLVSVGALCGQETIYFHRSEQVTWCDCTWL